MVTYGKDQDGSQGLLPVSSPDARATSLWVSFIRALMSFMRTPSSCTKHFPKPYLLILSSWAIGFQPVSFGGHRDFQTTAEGRTS